RAYGVTESAGRGGNVTLRFASGTVVDVLLTTPERFGLDWIRATGSPAHVAALETRARAMGVSLSASFVDEPAVYRALDHAWVPPELRSEETRLNSSHGSISYAVFCLKKKKETTYLADDVLTTQRPALIVRPASPIRSDNDKQY